MIAAPIMARRPARNWFSRAPGRVKPAKNRCRLARAVAAGLALGLLALLVLPALPADAAPLRRLGQNPRSLAMGGTGVSFANDEMALFYNPAGLGAIDNYWFEIPIAVGVSGDGITLAQDAAAGSGGGISDPASLVADNIGKEIRMRLFSYPNAVFNLSPGVTLGLAYFQEIQIEMQIRNLATPEIETFFRQDSGTVLGLSFPLARGQMLAGGAYRTLTRTGGEGVINSAALAVAAGSEAGLDLETELGAGTGSGTGYDLGMIWRMSTLARLRAQFGLAIQNVGGVDLKNAEGATVFEVPQEVSMGWSLRPRTALPILMAFEMRDMLGALSEDSSLGKRLHFGLEMGLVPLDKATNLLTLRGGYTAGSPSYGIELSIWHGFSLQYAEYYEEFGDVAGQDPRKRSLLTVLFGF